ncbi:MAG: UDP-N-acetylglucosamine 1-carboxyvinyltransferase [Bdellovibrionales bacterium]|nr:UDP-N-acetylglucosamine 1-carboxyvinyltransferase [Bdellovibrionales bacterium]
MDQIRVRGGKKLRGKVQASGSKNAALPILFATLLSEQKTELTRVPVLQDIRTTLKLLQSMGAEVVSDFAGNRVEITPKDIFTQEAPYDLVRTMRASVVVLGPLLARFGHAKVSLPGGCAIGARPINYHLVGLEKLGAKIELEHGYVIARAKKLVGNRVTFEFPSVGATENILMAATLAQGESVIENCAKEPEITDLARMLRAMGAEIEGEGTETIRVQGKAALHGARYPVMADRIEVGTFLAAAMATEGDVTVEGLNPVDLESVLVKFEEAGAEVTRAKESIRLRSNGRAKATDITTLPFPGFPTDMQAQFMTAMVLAEGASLITETIFENRFMHVPELNRLGADITIRGNSALVRGVPGLTAAPMMATDLRASASLILGALAAKGESVIRRIYHLDRGYERIEEKLKVLGADVERVSEG